MTINMCMLHADSAQQKSNIKTSKANEQKQKFHKHPSYLASLLLGAVYDVSDVIRVGGGRVGVVCSVLAPVHIWAEGLRGGGGVDNDNDDW